MQVNPCILLLFALLVVAGCNDSDSDSGQSAAESNPKFEEPEYPYPALPNEMRSLLWNQCDYVDIIFYDSPVSMSQTDAPAIRGTLGYISGRAAIPDANCSPLGRVTFMRQGEILIEADMYSRNNCHYFLFLQDGKTVYVEALSEPGKNFFRQVEQRFREVVQ